jgi:hypothetical protein
VRAYGRTRQVTDVCLTGEGDAGLRGVQFYGAHRVAARADVVEVGRGRLPSLPALRQHRVTFLLCGNHRPTRFQTRPNHVSDTMQVRRPARAIAER